MTSSATRRLAVVAVAGAALAAGALVPLAAADAVYHTEQLPLVAAAGEPLRSGFVQNIKAEGPSVYAREIFALNGARPGATYVVKRHFFFRNPTCAGNLGPGTVLTTLETNAAGNAKGGIDLAPTDIPPIVRGAVHGVRWTFVDSSGTTVYWTECTAVALD